MLATPLVPCAVSDAAALATMLVADVRQRSVEHRKAAAERAETEKTQVVYVIGEATGHTGG